jgi:DNA-binding Lrp family transcriptional regulator
MSHRNTAQVTLDEADRLIINSLQGGFPVVDEPFEEVGKELGLSGVEVERRVQSLLDRGALTRFGPLFNAERMGGGLTLAAMVVPQERYDEVSGKVNAHEEVAHNYARDHRLNMWFVLATEKEDRVGEVIHSIEEETGLKVWNMPKEQEFFVGLRFEV